VGGVTAAAAVGAAVFGISTLRQPAGGPGASANSGHPTLGIHVMQESTTASTLTINCSGGQRPIAGGYAIVNGDGKPVLTPSVRPITDAPTDSGWTVAVTGMPAGARLNGQVVCANATTEDALSGDFDGVQAYEVVRVPPGGSSGHTNAFCHGSRVPLGGGFNGAAILIGLLQPAAQGYELGDSSGKASLSIVCAAGNQDVTGALSSGALGWQLVTGPIVKAPPGKLTTVGVGCPAGWHVGGGGYGVESGKAAVQGNFVNGDNWEVHASGQGGTATITPYAVCVV
jgi:hypothetical protein